MVFTSGDAVVAANAGNVTRQLTFILPQNAEYGGDKAMFRFRFTTDIDPLPYGLAQDGEIEDYLNSDFLLTDWADLPEPKYITDALGGTAGPSHRIHYLDADPSASENYLNSLYIGATLPDAERDGQPTNLANGDNNNYQSDEDLSYLNFLNPGTNLPFSLISDEPIRLRIPVVNNSPSKAATLWAFIDWNGDGDFKDEGEKMSQTVATNYNGNIDFDFTIPKVAKSDSIGIRIRLTSGVSIDAYGSAPDGEVEDFVVEIRTLDYGDLPDVTSGIAHNDYQTLRSRNGARHGISVVPLVVMGNAVDPEVDGQPGAKSNGDDQNPQSGPDDEDGITFLTPLVPGYTSNIAFTGRNQSNLPATLYIYTDWTNDGILDLVTTYTLPANAVVTNQPISFYVPTSATFNGGNAFFRFRLTTDVVFNGAPSANGVAIDGEVEDYYVPLFKLGNLVWEDRNNNGLQDAEEINLGIQNVRVVMRFGGVVPANGTCDEVTQNTNTNPNTLTPLGAGADLIADYVIDTFTNAKGLYGFTGMIEGYYEIIALDTFGLTPTRFNWIKNVTEEDRDSDGTPLKNPWDYVSGERRQSKSQQFKLVESLIGINEAGILDHGNPQLLEPNAVEGLPDNKVEQRIDFGYVGLDLGDLAESGNNPAVSNFNTSENGAKPEGPKHIVTPDLRLGICQDVEWLGQSDPDAGEEFKPSPDAGGDDPIANFPYDPSQGRRWPFHDAANACSDDEDGIKFLTPMVAGYEAVISVKYSAKINFNGPDAYLHAWIDWNGDGNFDDGAGGVVDANEHIIFNKLDGAVVPNLVEGNTKAVQLEMSYLTSATDSITLAFKVPADAKYNNGNVLARFRISYDPQLGPTGILAPNLNFPDPQPGAGNSTLPGGVIPYGEVEDYFIALAKVISVAWQDQNYNGKQDAGEVTFPGQPVKLEFAGLDGIFGTGDYEYTYFDTTDATGKIVFCGLIGSKIIDPSAVDSAVYRLTVNVPRGTVPAFNLPAAEACSPLDIANSDGVANTDPGITQTVFSISNPTGQCTTEGDPTSGGGFPDSQTNGTIDFGFTPFDYGDLPVDGTNYLTLRDSLSAAFNNRFGPRHIIQSRLYLGSGVDAERNGQPDADAGNKDGGDDGVEGRFHKGTGADDETGIRLLTPMIPGEMAYLQVSYTSQDTILTGGYSNPVAFLRSFIDFNGDGDLNDLSDIVDYSLIAPNMTGPFSATTDNVQLAGGINQIQVLAFRVPVAATYRNGTAYMRHRLSWNSDPLGPDNNLFHQNTAPFVDTTLTYPKGEVEDYAIPLAKIGNLSWFDHDVFGDQDQAEDVVDSLGLVLIWGGVDAATGVFDTVGYFKDLVSGGNVIDIQYNRTIASPGVGDYLPGALVKTGTSPAADSGLYSFRGLIPGIYYVLPLKYFATDSATFVNAWPKHRVLTLQDNPGVDDNNDSDGLTSGLPGTSNRPGAMVRIRDGNSLDPEVLVNDRPLNENGKRDVDDNAAPFTTGVFPDNQWDKSIDFGWVDEPNIESSLDIVGVYFPTSEKCGNMNVILHMCVKNPQEVPLDSLQLFLNLKEAYGNALYMDSKLKISVADSAYINGPAYGKKKKSFAGAKDLLIPNPNYDGVTDTKLLLVSAENQDFVLKGDSIVCLRIEFEIDPTKTDKYPWSLQGSTTARAVGFNKTTGAKRPLTDYFASSPRFGKNIVVSDLTDEVDDLTSIPSGIFFEGTVADRGYKGTYQTPYAAPNVTGRDKYLDENDKAIQNDECWLKTKWNAGRHDVTIPINSKCESIIGADLLVPNFVPECGFDKYPEGSYYAVIIQDKETGLTVWTSDDPVPFDGRRYLDYKLAYIVKSVTNFCNPIFGDLTLEDKTAPVVVCPPNTDRKIIKISPLVTAPYQFVCTDIDSVLNVKKSWNTPTYAYYTGIATTADACGNARLESVTDQLTIFADCALQAANGNAYARIRRVFTYVDENGNHGNCAQIISFYRPVIKLPECKVDVANYLAKGDTAVIPADLVGKYKLAESVPYIVNGAGNRIYTTGNDICGFAFNYTDKYEFITAKGVCGRKIIRRWSIFDWCATFNPGQVTVPAVDGDCYNDITWNNSQYNWEQLIVIGDNTPPIVYALDVDLDGKIGSGYAGEPVANPKTETATYDPGDILVFSTGPFDCTGPFRFTKDQFKVLEQSEWCFDVMDVLERKPILDLFERPTGKFVMKANSGVKITRDPGTDCKRGYTVSGVPMTGDWFVQLRATNSCSKETIVLIPIQIKDKIAPTMKCNDQLNVTLDNVGTGNVTAKNLDAGSSDNCGSLKWVKVRRPVNDTCMSTFLKSWRVIDVNKDGKIGAKDNKEDYIDFNYNSKADDGEYFTISETTKRLMTPLMDTIPVYCCDGGNVLVELWGEDRAGNRNYCWQNLKLDDKTPIVCMPPLNVIIKCNDKNIGLIDNKKASAKLFGDVLIMSGNNCVKVDTLYEVVKKLACGGGTIERSWTLSKITSTGVVKTTCSQIITVQPMHEYSIRFPKDAVQKNCVKPLVDTVLTKELGCDILAVNVSDKRYNASGDECYKIFRTYTVINWCTYDDRCKDALDPANVYVVDRKWGNFGESPTYVLVRDAASFFNKGNNFFNDLDNAFFLSRDSIAWNLRPETTHLKDGVITDAGNDEAIFPTSECKGWNDNRRTYRDFEGNYHDYFVHSWMYTQVIKVYDDVRPVVLQPKLPTCPVSSATPGAASINFPIDPASCLGTMTIAFKGNDNCSKNLELEPTLISLAQGQDAKAPNTYDAAWSTARITSDSFKVTVNKIPAGTYDLIVVLRDECGNLSVPTRIPFVVGDCKAPAPICINSLSTDLMPTTTGGGAMAVWAKDFIASPVYDCSGQGPDTKDGLKLVTKYSINRVGKPKDVNATSLEVTCDDKDKQVLVEIHAWDEKGNDDFCVTYITVNDNRKVCPTIGSAGGDGEIAGLIHTESNQAVEGVTVELSGKAIKNKITAKDGKYSFTGLQKGHDYSITPILDPNPLNGVSTFDMVLMQKHILGLEILNSPYKMIAADVNNSKAITTLDMILLRKLILNLDTKFTSNTSWRFVDAAYRFPNPSDPWSEACPEIASINNLSGKAIADFVAVKIGDVNGNASPTSAAAVEPRKAGKLELSTEEQRIEGGQEYRVDIRAKDLKTIEGYQFTLELDRNKVALLDIEYGIAKTENFGVFKPEGIITTSWNRKGGAEIGDDAILFTLHLQGKGAAKLSEVLKISSRYTANEAYREGGDYLSVVMSYTKPVVISNRPELLQNIPNPFVDQTEIDFYLPQATEGRLTIRDVKGSIVYRLKAVYNKGWNQVTIKQSDLQAAGVLYYTLETPDFIGTKKMVLLNR